MAKKFISFWRFIIAKKTPLNNDLKNFIDTSDMILANRLSSELKKYKKKVFTRDIFQTDL